MKEGHLILDAEAISTKLKRIAYQIHEENYDAERIVLIGIAERGSIVARRLANALSKICSIPVDISEIRLDKTNPLSAPIDSDLDLDSLGDARLILVDDVANSGKTLFYAMGQLMNVSVAKLQVAVLVDRRHKRFPIACDYVGLSLNTTASEHIRVELGEEEAVYLT